MVQGQEGKEDEMEKEMHRYCRKQMKWRVEVMKEVRE